MPMLSASEVASLGLAIPRQVVQGLHQHGWGPASASDGRQSYLASRPHAPSLRSQADNRWGILGNIP